jgi:hypothetical protein
LREVTLVFAPPEHHYHDDRGLEGRGWSDPDGQSLAKRLRGLLDIMMMDPWGFAPDLTCHALDSKEMAGQEPQTEGSVVVEDLITVEHGISVSP